MKVRLRNAGSAAIISIALSACGPNIYTLPFLSNTLWAYLGTAGAIGLAGLAVAFWWIYDLERRVDSLEEKRRDGER